MMTALGVDRVGTINPGMASTAQGVGVFFNISDSCGRFGVKKGSEWADDTEVDLFVFMLTKLSFSTFPKK